MGSVGSKAAPSTSSSRVRVGSKAHRVLQSSCLGVGTTSQSQSQSQSRSQSQSQSHDDSDSDSDSDDDNNNDDDDQACDPRNKQNATNFTGAVSNQPKIKCYRKVKVEKSDPIASNDFTDTCSTNASSSSSSTTSSSSRFLSRFSFIPGNISFRLSRANSLGSSTTMNNEQDVADQHHQDVPISSSASSRVNLCSPRNHSEMDTSAIRHAREPIERNVRFSRTLSVGRLRDRVIRRSSLSDIQQVGEVRDTNQAGTLAPVVSPNSSAYPLSTVSSSFFSNQNFEVETSRAREARYHDLLEHTSNFLERRRRIRSQVRALQRLGSRFENLSGHERSCILSGQHRTGRCTCRPSNRDPHLNDDTSARASISRIVMLAEALFEVLDEIQQQSVVLSSRPSVSSIGSVPAPNEVVESLPVKLYTKLQKHQNEEVAQCYICLGEYEEGDRMRILPCHHEFHKTCVDKWLKEIHRVCPLCRGDICRSVSLPAEN